ncbi:hypothetical protein, variant 1 [Aphanomyces invadans]|uniref:ELYS-like domain-containing protein n=1 Tax=Aphanomyces invadans TaxID=157072 RepID=A0A024TFJ3_9STRA|nr:hypothetical protein, variant 1 [Aphanomyces invadans]ETV92813.1 hypothetical protein, variant 1 [Aphanomyces invadans]|eukprot:XP_008878583.1 hypothetical protein, variant 1 [Aphanomyces invadans]
MCLLDSGGIHRARVSGLPPPRGRVRGLSVVGNLASIRHRRLVHVHVSVASTRSSVRSCFGPWTQQRHCSEPVAVQTWVRSHVDRAQATAVHATSPEDLHATLRQVRGLRHVVQALIERLQRGQQAALPTTSFPVSNDAASWNPSTDGSLEYLVSLQDEITSVERMVEFNLWLMSRFQSSTLSFPSTSKMLHAILSSAGLVDLLPLPVEVTALLAHFQSVDAHTTSAIMLFLTLYTHDVRATTSNVSWAGVHAIAMEAATVLHLPRSHATHVLALWTVDHATSSLHRGLLQHACNVLSQSPPEFLDGHVVVAILEILLQLSEPQLAHTIATTCQVSLARETEDLTLLLLMLDICLRLDAWEVAWLLARRAPQYIETTMARLVEYHQARGNVRDVLLKMTWTPAEMAMWKSQRISANDQALLHLVRGEFRDADELVNSSAKDDHEWTRQYHSLLLRAVAPNAPEVAVSSRLEQPALTNSDNAPRPRQDRPQHSHHHTAKAAWPKPTKHQYELLYNPLPSKSSMTEAAAAFTLNLKKPVATAGIVSPKKAGLSSRGNSNDRAISTTLQESADVPPYQWLSTDLTPGPHSASNAPSKRQHEAGEPVGLSQPAVPHVSGHALDTPARKPHQAKEPHSLPARRNPIRDVRKKY